MSSVQVLANAFAQAGFRHITGTKFWVVESNDVVDAETPLGEEVPIEGLAINKSGSAKAWRVINELQEPSEFLAIDETSDGSQITIVREVRRSRLAKAS